MSLYLGNEKDGPVDVTDFLVLCLLLVILPQPADSLTSGCAAEPYGGACAPYAMVDWSVRRQAYSEHI